MTKPKTTKTKKSKPQKPEEVTLKDFDALVEHIAVVEPPKQDK